MDPSQFCGQRFSYLKNENYSKVTYTNPKDQESVQLSSNFNVHLTFNILNTLQGLVLEEDKETAVDLLGRYSRVLRSMLLNGCIESRLDQELDIVTDYLEIERIRMTDKFDFQINIPEALKKITIPKSIIISLVENAVKHGMRLLGSDGFIQIDSPGPDFQSIRILNNAPVSALCKADGSGNQLAQSLVNRFNQITGSDLKLRIVKQACETNPRHIICVALLSIAKPHKNVISLPGSSVKIPQT